VTKKGPRLHTASIHTGGHRDFFWPVLSQLNRLDLRCVGPGPALVSGTNTFPETKRISKSLNFFNDLKIMKIGTWNFTTLINNYRNDILTDEFRKFKLDLLGVSETHILGVGTMEVGDIQFI
jgi:hypothetical protein